VLPKGFVAIGGKPCSGINCPYLYVDWKGQGRSFTKKRFDMDMA
jgi:hypothetical protein